MKKARAARILQFERVVPRSAETKASMVIEAGGAVIRLESGFDAELLLEAISALRGAGMIAHGLPVYVALEPVDMRFGHERLGGIVLERCKRSHA